MARIITPESAKEMKKSISLVELTSPRLAKKQVSPSSPTTEATQNITHRESKSPQRIPVVSGTPVSPPEQSKSEITQPILSRPVSSPTKIEVGKASSNISPENNSWDRDTYDSEKLNNRVYPRDLGLRITKTKSKSHMPPNVPFHQRPNYGGLKYNLSRHQFVKDSPDEAMLSAYKDGFVQEPSPYEVPALTPEITKKMDDLKKREINAAKWRNQLERSEQAGSKLKVNKSYTLAPHEVNRAIDNIVRDTGPAHGRVRPEIPNDIEMTSPKPSGSQSRMPRCMRKHPVNEPPKMDEGESPKKQRRGEGSKKGETHFPILVDKEGAVIRVHERLTNNGKLLQDIHKGDEERYLWDNSRRLRDLERREKPAVRPETPVPERTLQKGTKTKRQNNKIKGKRQVTSRQGREMAERAAAAAHSDLQMDIE